MREMRLDVPFVPEEGAGEDYHALLRELAGAGRLGSVHVALQQPGLPDARVLPWHGPRHGPAGLYADGLDAAGTARALGALPGVHAYILANARFHTASIYNDPQALLAALRAEGAEAFSGIVFADALLLHALAAADSGLCARFEAVPSVNCRLKTPAELDALLLAVECAGFRPPSMLVPDRELNRDLRALERFSEHARARLPGVRVVLLANEGCLAHCPFRLAHEAVIAHARHGGDQEPFALVRDRGCLRAFMVEPWRLLASPFIRPEDAHRYEGLADGIKVCGRTRGAAFLARAVRAYAEGRWEGNLLELMDTQEALCRRVHVDNAALPGDYHATVTACTGHCTACGACEAMAEAALGMLPAAPEG